jgi:hypothetical protein
MTAQQELESESKTSKAKSAKTPTGARFIPPNTSLQTYRSGGPSLFYIRRAGYCLLPERPRHLGLRTAARRE